MKYMGSKNRIAKYLLPIILKDRKPEQWYVEPFVGGANMIDKVEGNRIGSDFNESLVMCHAALSEGWTPPEEISRELYNEMRTKNHNGEVSALIGYVGICGSYGGRWFDGGYAGKSITKQGKERNYPAEAFKNVMLQAEKLKGITFISSDYKELTIPSNSIVYCDPEYVGTKQYKKATESGFSSAEHWQWCRDLVASGHKVFVSEYIAPDDFVCVWEKEVKSSLGANGVAGGSKSSAEKLFIHESQA